MKKIRNKNSGQFAWCDVYFSGPLEGQIFVSNNRSVFKVYKTWKNLWRYWELVEETE